MARLIKYYNVIILCINFLISGWGGDHFKYPNMVIFCLARFTSKEISLIYILFCVNSHWDCTIVQRSSPPFRMLLLKGGTTRTGYFKSREVKTGFRRNRSMQTGSSGTLTLIGWKSAWSNHFCPSMGQNGGCGATDSVCRAKIPTWDLPCGRQAHLPMTYLPTNARKLTGLMATALSL